RWAGLWDFPRFGLSVAEGDALDRQLMEKLRELTGVVARPRELISTFKHGVTRFRIALDCYAADYVSAAKRPPDGAELRWVSPSDFESYPLSVTGRKLSRLALGEQQTGQSSTYSWLQPAEASIGTTISSPHQSQM